MPMNRSSRLLLKQVLVAIITFSAVLSQSILSREDKEFSQKCGTFNSIYCSAITITFSLMLQKERSEGILLPSLLVSSLFFISSQLNFYFIPLLNATYTTICTQPRLITIYVLSLCFMRNKFKISNFLGICLIILSLVLLSIDKEGGLEKHFMRNCCFVSLGSVFSGTAFFSFDYFIKGRVLCPHNYVFVSQVFTMLFSVLFLFLRKHLFSDAADFSVLRDPRFYSLASSYTVFTICVFMQSFLFGMIPRVLLGIITHTTSDIITEWRYRGGLSWSIALKYTICVSGVLIYQHSMIRSYFKKRPTAPE